jgi:hypothetical protein
MENLTEKATFLERKSFTMDDKALVVKFRLMGAEEENENKRVYPRPVLAKAVEELRAKLAKRKASFALTTHKDDENVDDVAAVLEDVEMTGNDVFATARVLPTQRGKNVQAILRGGGAIGVSAKCYGSVKDGRVQPGLVLRGFDFVTAPGFGTYADKSNIIESCTIQEDDGAVTLAELESFGLEPLEPVQEEILRRRYESAVRLAGYKGTFEQYKKIQEKR